MNILITGATSGIGKQLTADYHSQGHKVWAVGRNESALEALQEMGVETGRLDLTERDVCLEWFKTLPHIDLAVLNAGNCEYIDLPKFDSESVMRVMRANVDSLAISIEGVLPLLRMSESGHLAITGSSAA